MAENFNAESFNALTKRAYSVCRENLHTGDLLFCAGNYAISQAIEKITGSIWSHVAIIYKVEELNRILVLESVEDVGVRFSPLSKYLNNYDNNNHPYDGHIALARYKPGLTKEQINTIISFGMDELTRPYDKSEALKILSRVVLGKGKEVHDREYLCSELVYECYKKADIDLKYDVNGFISPQDIWENKDVELICALQ